LLKKYIKYEKEYSVFCIVENGNIKSILIYEILMMFNGYSIKRKLVINDKSNINLKSDLDIANKLNIEASNILISLDKAKTVKEIIDLKQQAINIKNKILMMMVVIV